MTSAKLRDLKGLAKSHAGQGRPVILCRGYARPFAGALLVLQTSNNRSPDRPRMSGATFYRSTAI